QPPARSGQTRRVTDETELRHWLENMAWFHRYTPAEMSEVTGLDPAELADALTRFHIQPGNPPLPEVDPPLFVLPYPGGRHPRIVFLDGAIEPQRETKLSIFAPWDRTSYVVLDVPEAIWSNLGLTYLAHTHIDTLWTKQGIALEPQEWQHLDDGSFRLRRVLPNQIAWQVIATPHRDHLAIRMSLTNGTPALLTDLRVQMCAMLRGLKGFDQQTNDNKLFRGSLAACGNPAGDRWLILGFEPIQRTWGNPPCPCLHADPQFPDCPPGETREVHGWLSFHQGLDIDAELERIDRLWNPTAERVVRGQAFDAATGQPMACRLTVRDESGQWRFAEPATAEGQVIRYEKQNWLNSQSQEFHSSISPHPFELRLAPGRYTLTAECGKEYLPWTQTLVVDQGTQPLEIRLARWIHMAQQGWYSGDAHVHRPIAQLGVPMLADDVNVAFPMVYWTTRSELSAAAGDRTNRDDATRPARAIWVDATHVIWPRNTEWEIFAVGGRQHTLGALFAVNHQAPFDVGIPPVRNVLEQADREGAILDLDKHDWPFAMVLPPLLGGRLTFELANNHMWRTEFAFRKWSTPAADSMGLADVQGGDERDWMEFTHRSYWALLNCGYRLQPTAGTATGVHPVPIGYGRVYVHVPGRFDYDRWIEGLRAGRSFVTTGPMVRVERDGPVLNVQVDTDGPIERLEWIVNGRVERATPVTLQKNPDGSVHATLQRATAFAATSWVAVRVWQRSEQGRWRFAHSAPAWFEVPGRPIRPSAQEQEFLIRRMEAERERSRTVLPADALREYDEALEAYRRLKP
ncbi:MAG: hypothetical protein ACKOGA_13470, partial [Planctomycetaceae bacterium]